MKTCLGLVVQKNERYKWVFVSESGLTGSPDKLRWSSIGFVAMAGSCLFLQQDLPIHYELGSRLWVIDIEKGICASMKEGIKSFDLQGDTLTLDTKNGAHTYRVKQILNALAKVGAF